MAFLKSFCSALNIASKNSPNSLLRIVGVAQQSVGLSGTTNISEGGELPISPAFHIATHHMNKIALKDQNGSHTYQEILGKSLILAQEIQHKIGVNKTQERIAFLCPNDVTYVIAQWACWAAGHIGKTFVMFVYSYCLVIFVIM